MDDIRISREGKDPDRERNVKAGCLVVALGVLAIPAIIVAIPLIAGLYRWGFGG